MAGAAEGVRLDAWSVHPFRPEVQMEFHEQKCEAGTFLEQEAAGVRLGCPSSDRCCPRVAAQAGEEPGIPHFADGRYGWR